MWKGRETDQVWATLGHEPELSNDPSLPLKDFILPHALGAGEGERPRANHRKGEGEALIGLCPLFPIWLGHWCLSQNGY